MVADRLDEDELRKLDLRGREGETFFINESGLYSVILRSDKPEAKKFRKWVTSEILPQIRKSGMYTTEKVRNIARGAKYEAALAAKELFGRYDVKIIRKVVRAWQVGFIIADCAIIGGITKCAAGRIIKLAKKLPAAAVFPAARRKKNIHEAIIDGILDGAIKRHNMEAQDELK
jgi:hypothetical protein